MVQPAILLPPPPVALFFTLRGTRDLLDRADGLALDDRVVVGLGAAVAPIPGLRPFPTLDAEGVPVPSTQDDAWVYVRGADAGEVLRRACRLRDQLGGEVGEEVSTFVHGGGRDLSGYEDGTENPQGEAAVAAAVVAEGPYAGSSFVAAQRWAHDLQAFDRLPQAERDHTIGRRLDSNEELAEAPPSAHVKRAAQESFDPPAFMLRRSMPYGGLREHGLYFVAFGADLDRFERVLRRMCGEDDGVRDALFRFSRPLSGGYYWCPPARDGRLDLSVLA